jgi:hypothetical protein
MNQFEKFSESLKQHQADVPPTTSSLSAAQSCSLKRRAALNPGRLPGAQDGQQHWPQQRAQFQPYDPAVAMPTGHWQQGQTDQTADYGRQLHCVQPGLVHPQRGDHSQQVRPQHPSLGWQSQLPNQPGMHLLIQSPLYSQHQPTSLLPQRASEREQPQLYPGVTVTDPEHSEYSTQHKVGVTRLLVSNPSTPQPR